MSFTAQEFRKSSYSTESGNNCVEIARRPTLVAIRDSKIEFGSPQDAPLRVPSLAFNSFLAAVRSGGR